MLRTSSPGPTEVSGSTSLPLSSTCSARQSLCWRLCQPEPSQKIAPLPRCWWGTTTRVQTEAAACSYLLNLVEELKWNNKWDWEKQEGSTSFIVQFCCQHPIFSRIAGRCQANRLGTSSQQASPVQIAEAGPEPLPSTHTAPAWPWGAGWVARRARAKNPFLFWPRPSPLCSGDVHYPPECCWPPALSQAPWQSGKHCVHLLLPGKESYGSSAYFCMENLREHRHWETAFQSIWVLCTGCQAPQALQ